MDNPKDANYHLQSMRCAMIREELGGAKAVHSSLFSRSVGALMDLGLSESEIIEQYKSRFSRASQTEEVQGV